MTTIIRRTLVRLLFGVAILLILTPGCSHLHSRKQGALAADVASRRFFQLNSKRYVIQYSARTTWDATRGAWHAQIIFLSGGGQYDAWIDPKELTIIDESLTDPSGKKAASLDELLPANYPRWPEK